MKVLINPQTSAILAYGMLNGGQNVIEVSEAQLDALQSAGAKFLLEDLTVRVVPPANGGALPSSPMRDSIVAVAQSAVGIQLTNLTPAQQRSLLACLLYRAGGVRADMTVAPLGEWLA